MKSANTRIVQKATPRFFTVIALSLVVLCRQMTCFTFSSVEVSMDSNQIGTTTTYYFYLDRQYDDSLATTAWATTPLSASDLASLKFPPQYTTDLISNAACLDLSVNDASISGYGCAVSGSSLVITNAFGSGSSVYSMYITVGGVVNPGSTITTSPFTAAIAKDSSGNSSSAQVTFTPGQLSSLSINFAGGVINQTSDMLITFVVAHSVPQNGTIQVTFPNTLTWARDLSPSHTIPINGTLSCYGTTTNIKNTTISCQGLFATQTITVTSPFAQPLAPSDTITFAIKGLFAPPSTQQIDKLKVMTCDSALNSIDIGSSFISGLVPQTLSNFAISPTVSPLGVNNFVGGLSFSFTLPDTISSSDIFVIAFPANTSIIFTMRSGNIGIQGASYNSTNTSLIFTQSSSNPNYGAGTAITLTFIKYKAPPSVRPSGSISVSVLQGGYSKLTGSGTVSAVANNYSLSVAAASATVNAFTSYTFSFVMSDPLTSSGYIALTLDPNLCRTASQVATIQSNLSVSISGATIKANPSTQVIAATVNGSATYSLLLTSLNTSASYIPTQTLSIKVSNLQNYLSVLSMTYFSLSTYYSSSLDLVANANYSGSITLQPGTISLMSVSSTASTTYTFCSLTIELSNQNPIPANGYLMVVLPGDLNVLSVYQSTINISSTLVSAVATNYLSNNSIVIKLASVIAGSTNLKVVVANFLTQNITKTTATFILRTYDQSFSPIDISSNTLGLALQAGNPFNAFTLTRSNTTNSATSNYTLYFEQLQNSTNVTTLAISLNQSLLTSSLGQVYQQLYNPSTSTYSLVALSFSKTNSTYLRVTLNQSASSHTIILSTITNFGSQQPVSNSILVCTLTSDYQYIYSQAYAQDITNDAASADIVTSYSFSSLAYDQVSTLTLVLKQPTNWPTLVYSLQLTLPSAFGTTGIGCTGFAGIVCSWSGTTRKLSVTTSNGSYLASSPSVIVSNLVNPGVGSGAQTLSIASFDSGNYLVQQDGSTIIFNNLCTMPCRTCNTSNASYCLSCYSSNQTNFTYLYQNQCLSKCPTGSYQLSSSSCAPCAYSCASCAYSSSNCSSCNATGQFPYFYKDASVSPTGGSCLSLCNGGSYSVNFTCYDCNSSCSSCTNSTYCNTCKSNYYFYKGSCLTACPNTTITANNTCQDCSPSCSTCAGTLDYCTTCPPFTFLSNGSCLTSCPSPNMFVNTQQACQPCDLKCATCNISSTNCTSCNTSSSYAHLYNYTCLVKCPELYYSNVSTLVCSSCSSAQINCSNCSSSSICLSCDPTYLFFQTNSTCTKQVGIGFVAINGTIYACNSTCYTCAITQNNCTACSGTLSLFNNQCTSQCPPNITVNLSNICTACKSPCATCVNSTSTCTSCSNTSSLYYNEAAHNCVAAGGCPNGTFANSSSFVCDNCSSTCTSCSGKSDNCSSCKAGFLYYSSNNSCLSLCPNGTVGIAGICQKCTSPCLTCNLTQTNCTSCVTSTPTLYLDASSSLCVVASACPSSTYPNTSLLVCQKCVSPCSQCSSLAVCTACLGNYSLFYVNGSCLQSCPDGWMAFADGSNQLCQACLNPCATCKGALNNCTSCIANSSLFLQGNGCVNAGQCANLTYPNSSTNKCTACRSPCLSCTSQTNCTTCVSSYYLYNYTCVNSSSCPAGTVAGTNSSTGLNQCISCIYPCLNCSIVPTNCTSCNSSSTKYYLNGNICGNASSCPNLTYPNSTTSKCQVCINSCLSCSNDTYCLSCVSGFVLSLNSSCVSSCPIGQYAANVSGILMCKNCSSSCFGCSGSTSNCTTCNNLTFLSNGSCVNESSCPNGTYANTSSNTCDVCLSPCSSCLNSSFCKSCSSLYLISSAGQCVNSTGCPNNTVAYNSSGVLLCSACDPSCNGCAQKPTNCTSCSNSSTFLQNGTCVNSSGCVAGTYPNKTLGTCSKCQVPCNECSNSSFCSSCVGSLYLVVQGGSCVNSSSCPTGTTAFNANGSLICANCSSNCQNCAVTPSNCSSCPSNSSTFLQNNSCVTAADCINGSYPNSSALTCSACPSSCALCSASSNCSKCSPTFYLYGLACVSSCPNGTLADNLTSSCKNCNSPCSTCSQSVNSCTSCDQTNVTLYLLNSSCVIGSSCSSGTYPNSSTFTCAACNENCTTCTSYLVCTSCVSGFYLYSSKTCVNVCPDGWLGVVVNGGGVCQQCTSPCLTCSVSLSGCTSCLQNLTTALFLDGSSCVEAPFCHNGTYANTTNFKCTTCSAQCSSCVNSSTYCLSCSLSYYMLNHSCLSTCPNTTIADQSSQTCKPCTNPCNTCNNQLTTCTSCSAGTFLQNSSCLSTCPDGTAAVSETWSCQTCQQGCTLCYGSISNCSSCSSGFFYYNFTCSQKCPSRYYGNTSSNECSPCVDSCYTCSNSTSCLSCSAPFLLYSQQCLSSCPQALPYNVSNVCMNCSSAISGCVSCNSNSMFASCQLCSQGLLKYDETCVSKCPSGFSSDGNGSCKESQSSLNGTLTGSLTTAALFPLPFTITGSIIFVACFMSKLQNKNTYITGVAYALYGFIQTACLAYVILTFTPESDQADYKTYLLVALFVIGGLNIFGLVVQSWQLGHDQKFSKWLKSKCNFVFYGTIVLVSALANYKFKLILFTKLFNFQCVRAQLDNVQKFRVFNLLSFLGCGHQGLILYISALILVRLAYNTPQFLLFLDLIAVNILNVILALAASSKSENFFEEQEEDGMKVNKVFNIHEQYQINPIDDTLDQVKRQKGLDSRQIMMDDDEFTLSISDREESAQKPQPQSSDKFAHFKQNKTLFLSDQANVDEITNSEKNGRDDFYQGGQKSAHRQRREAQNKSSDVILQKKEQQANDKQDQNQQVPKFEGNSLDKNIFEADEDVQLPEQTDLIPDVGLLKRDSNVENQLQISEYIKVSELTNGLENFENKEANLIKNEQGLIRNPQEQMRKQEFQRQIKIYKGKGQLLSSLPEDLQEIDLAINKKQQELIQLKQAIRRKEKSHGKRTKSKDKISKGPQSQRGADFFNNNFMQRMSSQQLLNPKMENKKIPLNINVINGYAQPGIIEEQLQAGPGCIKRIKKDKKQVEKKNQNIELQKNEKSAQKTPFESEQKIQEPMQNSLEQKQRKLNSSQSRQIVGLKQKKPLRNNKEIKYQIQDMNEMYFQSKEIPYNQDQAEKLLEDKEAVEQEPLVLHKNIFQDPKDLSLYSQEPINNPNLIFVGMKAPSRKQKLLESTQRNQALPQPQIKIDMKIDADQQNTPLKSRKNILKNGFQGQVTGQNILQDQIEPTQRVKVSPNRSHLLKEQEDKKNTVQYQEISEISTVRQPSFIESTSRKNFLQRPPLQNRPSTSVKNKLINGLQNMQTNRADTLSRQSGNWESLHSNFKQGQLKQSKSRQFKRIKGNLESYPSSFSSNQMKRVSEQLDDEPQKPTILRTIKTKERQNSYKKYIQEQQISGDNRSSRKSIKSYKSRSIDKEQAQEYLGKAGQFESGDLDQYYNKKERSRSNKSRSRSREGNRSSDKRLRELQKIYLQRLQFKQ